MSATITDTLGAAFLGGMTAAILFGVTCVQTYLYFQRFKKDGRTLKATVAVLWLLDALDLAFAIHMLYFYLVINFLNPFAFTAEIWSIVICILLTAIIHLVVCCTYAWRIWIVSGHNRYLTALPVILSLINISISIAIVVNCFELKLFALIVPTISWMLYSSFGAGVAADLCISVTLCYFLHRNRSGFRPTDSTVNRLMLYCISTNLAASASALAILITFVRNKNSFVYMAIWMVVPKVYCNALLASLNARERSDTGVNAMMFNSSVGPTTTGISSSASERRIPTEIMMGSTTSCGYPSSGPTLKDRSMETMVIGYDKEVEDAV